MSTASEKSVTQHVVHTEHMGGVDAIETLHQDGTVDYVDRHAVGGDLAKMPDGYFYSIQFIGTVIVSSL